MAINPLLLNVKPISEITTVDNPIKGHLLFYDGSDELKKVDIIEFQSLIGGIAKPLAIADATPTTAGWYKPTTSGTYANAGGLVAQKGYDTLFYFDGTTWSLIAADLPQPIVNNYTNNNTYNLDPEQIVPSEATYQDDTLAGDILKRVDKATGENANFKETLLWKDGSTMSDDKVDGVIYIKNGEKYYKRQYDILNVKWFGAKGDGVTDDTVAIQQALDFGGKILLSEGDYYINSNQGLFIHVNGTEFYGVNGKSKLIAGSRSQRANGYWYRTLNVLNFETLNVEDVKIHDIIFERTPETWVDEFDQFYHQINIVGATNVEIYNNKIVGTLGDGICLGGTNNITPQIKVFNKNIFIHSNILDGVNNQNRNGISVIDGENVYINNNSISNFTRSDMPGGIDVEPNNEATYIIKNVHIENNTLYNIGGNAGIIGVYGGTSPKTIEPNNIHIRNNVFLSGGAIKNTYAFFIDLKATDKDNTSLTPKNNIVIDGNIVEDNVSNNLFILYSVKGIQIKNNTFQGYNQGGFISFGTSSSNKRTCIDVEIDNNTFKDCGNTSGLALRISYVDGLKLTNNRFKDSATSTIIDISGGADLKNVTIDGNTFANINRSATYYLHLNPAVENIVDFTTFYIGLNNSNGNLISILKKNFKGGINSIKTFDTIYTGTANTGDFNIYSPSVSEGIRTLNSRVRVNFRSDSTTTNNLWRDLQLVKIANTADLPTANSFNGEMVFDTNLERPKWFFNGVWKDYLKNATSSGYGFVKQSSVVADVSTTPPDQLGAQTVTTIQEAQTAINNLVAMVNAMRANEVELKTKLNAKLTADRNSGQQAIQ